jgi:hypothetical protein
MSNSEHPPGEDGQGSAASARAGCLTALMILGGAVLLLPGACAIFFVFLDWKGALSGSFLPVLAVCLAVGFGGIMLIRAGLRGPSG